MTRWVTCREFVEFLDDYLAGRLSAVQVEEFNHHLSACPPCVTYMQTYRGSSALVKAALGDVRDDVPDSVPEELVAAILAARRKGTRDVGAVECADTFDGSTVTETFWSGRNLLTPHAPTSYPGLQVIRPGRWAMSLIMASTGQTVVALGGERVFAYETVDGGHAQGFELRAGDEATLVRMGLAHGLAEWRIERGAPTATDVSS